MKRLMLIALAVVLVAGFILYEILQAPNLFYGDRVIAVSRGESFAEVVDSLERAGIIRSRTLFVAAGRILGWTKKMQIGKYRFKRGVSNKRILEDIRHGRSTELVIVTVREGLKASRQARLLEKSLGIDSARFMSLVDDSSFARVLGVEGVSLEGYLMPNTYMFYWQTDEQDIIKEMVDVFWRVFSDTLKARMESRGMTLQEILTVASIVEAETAVDSERALVAGVYYNRLQKKMRLEADPTVQYVLEDGPRRLRYSDLARNSPYNTYRHYGLPPGPVNNPGRGSILAALYPARHKYLYFVANGQGGHTFSKTYAEHRRAVQQYRRMREEQQAMKAEG